MNARVALFALLGVLGCSAGPAPTRVAQASRPAACQGTAPSYQEVQPLFGQYCLRCHREGGDAGDLDFSRVEVLTRKRQRVVGALDAHAMPPPGLPQPNDAERERMSLWAACRRAE